MTIQRNFPLKEFTTFGFDVKADQYVIFRSIEALRSIVDKYQGPFLLLGGGSNICFTRDIDQMVLHNQISGIEIIEEDARSATIEVGAGENWHSLVEWAVDHQLGGLENMALIPGTVGAAPIQNIGAYGRELKDVFVSLDAFDIERKKIATFHAQDCKFGYRDSYFKNAGKGKFVIVHVRLKLQKCPHTLHTEYGAIQKVLDENKNLNPSIRDIFTAVIQIRESKLPDPKVIGNAGSFFKNPEVSQKQFLELQSRFEDLVFYAQPEGTYKIPAGWLIEKCGWKGKKVGNVGCHKDQALVLVHFGGGKGTEILKLSEQIRRDVDQKFGIQLQPEVNII